MFAAFPCATWSLASAGAYRTREHIWGRPDLPPHLLRRLLLGNQTLRATINLIKAALANHVPVVVENPATSIAWSTPGMIKLRNHIACREVVTDHCAHGARWRKPTRLVSWHAGLAPAMLHARCHRRGLLCSWSGLPHIVLQGKCPGSSLNWTQLAQEYPRRLATLIAAWLIGAGNAIEDSHVLSLIS